MLETSVRQIDATVVDFWNGNRSEIRKEFECEVLKAILSITVSEFGSFKIEENVTEYPGLEESVVFSEKKHHLFVTVAGNQKFNPGDFIMIAQPIAKNLLGYRIPIIKQIDADKFQSSVSLSQLQQLRNGIPVSWSDATIFRYNGYNVAEEGDFDDVFERLSGGKFDYTCFGANEVQRVFKNRGSKNDTLTMDDNIMFFYPFPLVFYVNPQMPELAERIEIGLKKISETGKLDTIFKSYYANIVEELGLQKRKVFLLKNPLIPSEFAHLKPDLAGF
jgi:hypothetical protein